MYRNLNHSGCGELCKKVLVSLQRFRRFDLFQLGFNVKAHVLICTLSNKCMHFCYFEFSSEPSYHRISLNYACFTDLAGVKACRIRVLK